MNVEITLELRIGVLGTREIRQERFHISSDELLAIGSSTDNTLLLENSSLSPSHGAIYIQPDGKIFYGDMRSRSFSYHYDGSDWIQIKPGYPVEIEERSCLRLGPQRPRRLANLEIEVKSIIYC